VGIPPEGGVMVPLAWSHLSGLEKRKKRKGNKIQEPCVVWYYTNIIPATWKTSLHNLSQSEKGQGM
jgi:hypothetical protein